MAKTIRIRMYRPGFGDCFLLSFGPAKAAHHVLIDFGAHQQGEIGTMEPIMDDIEKTTGKVLHLVIATHQHRDHISGFGKFAERFGKFTIGEVWMPWSEDPNDAAAVALQKKHMALYDRLEAHLQVALAVAKDKKKYDAALAALDNLRGNGPARVALQHGFGTGASVRYFKGGLSNVTVAAFPGLSVDILGPPKDEAALGRMNPPADQHFFTAPGQANSAVRPFLKLEIPVGSPDYSAIVTDGQPVLTDDDLTALQLSAESPADRLALALDNVRNNTSLVTLFRFGGRVLLFPGDAQWGNWQSWIGTDRGKELLGQVDFLKVAHHGSENATPVDVEKALRSSGVAAMVPTQKTPFPTIPRMPLLAKLEQHCPGHVAVRSDWIDVPNAPQGPMPKAKLPKGYRAGELWIDYTL